MGHLGAPWELWRVYTGLAQDMANGVGQTDGLVPGVSTQASAGPLTLLGSQHLTQGPSTISQLCLEIEQDFMDWLGAWGGLLWSLTPQSGLCAFALG